MKIDRDLVAASSAPVALRVLAAEESHGYALLQRVRAVPGAHTEWADGMFYPVLHRLERMGYLESRWEVAASGRRRKCYRVTPRGRACRHAHPGGQDGPPEPGGVEGS